MSLTRRVFLERIAQIGGYSAAFRTMQVLGLTPDAGCVFRSPRSPRTSDSGKSVVILGGGIAGLVSAYELCKAGFDCTILEARSRPGGRNWTVRNGTKVEFIDGTTQDCSWSEDGYLNAGPARIPSIHSNLLGYCQELGVPLEVEVNVSRSALMQSPLLNGGKPVSSARSSTIPAATWRSCSPSAFTRTRWTMRSRKRTPPCCSIFCRSFGDLNESGKYVGSLRAGFTTPRGAGPTDFVLHEPLKLHELLAADLSKGEFYEEEIDWQARCFSQLAAWTVFPMALSAPCLRA